MTLYNVGPTSKTLGRRCINVIQCVVLAGQVDFLSNIVHLSNVGPMCWTSVADVGPTLKQHWVNV